LHPWLLHDQCLSSRHQRSSPWQYQLHPALDGFSLHANTHKFVCRGTIEDKISRMIADKTALATKSLSVDLERGQDSAGLNLTEMIDTELLSLLALDIVSSSFYD
jgi:hypothetical protein